MDDLQNGNQSVVSKIQANQVYKQVSVDVKLLERKSVGDIINNPTSESTIVKKNKKINTRRQKDSLGRLLNIFFANRGNGLESVNFLRRAFLQAVLKVEPKIFEILSEETIKALGCSQEQLYLGFPQLNNLTLLPDTEGIYIPVKNIDLFSSLKIPPKSAIGRLYYEKENPQNLSDYIQYGGTNEPTYPMNKELNFRMSGDSINQSFFGEFLQYYKGLSKNNLFDITYTQKNGFGETGDFFRVFLINRDVNQSNSAYTQSATSSSQNKVGTFVSDYYRTIKLVEPVNFLANLINQLTGAIDIKANVGFEQIQGNQKFYLLVQRILGLCFDNRVEIDVSGISKVSELDALDDSFWEIDSTELTIIQQKVTDIQNRVVEFEDCENIKLPVNYESLVDQLIEFREVFNEGSIEQNTDEMIKILDSISNNPDWKPLLPTSLNLEFAVNKSILEIISNALVATILSPKNLLPLYIMLGVLEKTTINNVNSVIGDINNLNKKVNRSTKEITDSNQFLLNFKSFSIGVISRVGEIFLETLFEIIKKDIFILIGSIISDISRYKFKKKYRMILRLLELVTIIAPAISDYRKCKSLIDDILRLLRLINLTSATSIPQILLLAAEALPGKSPQRAAVNTYENLNRVGIPTEPLPDGSPNLMNQMIFALLEGLDKEESENGKVEVTINPLTQRIIGKSY